MLNSSSASRVGSRGSPAWDYQATFAPPIASERPRRSARKSRRFLRVNPLSLNPVTPPASMPGTPKRKSFASSLFHRRSAASPSRSAFRLSALQGHPGSVTGAQSAPSVLLSQTAGTAQPFAMSGRLGDSTNRAESPRSLKVPPQTHPYPQRHRNSRMTVASADSDGRSIEGSVRTKPHNPSKLRNVEGSERRSRKDRPLPSFLPPVPAASTSWLKLKSARRSYSTTASRDDSDITDGRG